MTDPLANMDSGCSGEDVAANTLGDFASFIVGLDKRVESQGITSDQCGHIGTAGSADHDICIVRLPSGSEANRHQRGHLISGAGDAPTSEDQSYPAHVTSLFRSWV